LRVGVSALEQLLLGAAVELGLRRVAILRDDLRGNVDVSRRRHRRAGATGERECDEEPPHAWSVAYQAGKFRYKQSPRTRAIQRPGNGPSQPPPEATVNSRTSTPLVVHEHAPPTASTWWM